jgi:hypothetical protein
VLEKRHASWIENGIAMKSCGRAAKRIVAGFSPRKVQPVPKNGKDYTAKSRGVAGVLG